MRSQNHGTVRDADLLLEALGVDGPNMENKEHWVPLGEELSPYQQALLEVDIPFQAFRHRTVNVS